MKLIFIDVETTGVDDSKHGLIQLGGIIEIDGKEADRFNYLIKPFPDDAIEDGALRVTGRSLQEIEGFKNPKEVYFEFMCLLNGYIDKYNRFDKFQFIGYNSRFDDGFLRTWFKKNNDNFYGSYFFWPAIDVSNMAACKYMETRQKFSNFKLMTIAKVAGLEIDLSKAHDAMYDIEVTKNLFYIFNESGKVTDAIHK